MNKLNFLIILSLIITGCKHSSIHEQVVGNWYMCEFNGDYSELHISQNYFEIYLQSNPTISSKFYYQFFNDTIFFSKTPLNKASDTTKAVVKLLNEHTIKWQIVYDTLLEPVQLNKLTLAVTKFPEGKADSIKANWYYNFKEEFVRRMSRIKCLDQRTQEEKVKDSLEQIEADSIFKIIDDDFVDFEFQ